MKSQKSKLSVKDRKNQIQIFTSSKNEDIHTFHGYIKIMNAVIKHVSYGRNRAMITNPSVFTIKEIYLQSLELI